MYRLWMIGVFVVASCLHVAALADESYDGTRDDLKSYVNDFDLRSWSLPERIDYFETSDGVYLRYARWPATTPVRGAVVHFNGRSEFIERNVKTYKDLTERGWEVWTLDWRGQGLSHRPLEGEFAVRGHIDGFGTYVADAKRFIDRVVKLEERPGKHVLLAHSMGGQIGLRYLLEHPRDFDLVALSSPLIRLPGRLRTDMAAGVYDVVSDEAEEARSCARIEILKKIKSPEEWSGSFDGSACSALVAPAEAELSHARDTYGYTHDVENLAAAECLIERSRKQGSPGLAVACATKGWLVAAYNSTDVVLDRKHELTMPILIVAAQDDPAVDPKGQQELCASLESCTLVQVPSAGHEILIETPDIRATFLACFDAFVAEPSTGSLRCREKVEEMGLE